LKPKAQVSTPKIDWDACSPFSNSMLCNKSPFSAFHSYTFLIHLYFA
jgi:hypothetical protein